MCVGFCDDIPDGPLASVYSLGLDFWEEGWDVPAKEGKCHWMSTSDRGMRTLGERKIRAKELEVDKTKPTREKILGWYKTNQAIFFTSRYMWYMLKFAQQCRIREEELRWGRTRGFCCFSFSKEDFSRLRAWLVWLSMKGSIRAIIYASRSTATTSDLQYALWTFFLREMIESRKHVGQAARR